MLVGHQKQWQFLKKSAELGRIPHGILFYGQEQLGKKTLAIEFAKFLNCSSEDFAGKPCQICRNCQDIQKRLHLDFILLEPLFPRREIQISQIRDLIWKLSLRTFASPFKIAIIDKAHSMTQEAQSCFLKLLEEPKGKAILILITEYPETLLPTIISRVQKLRFFPVERTEMENYIISKGISPKTAKYLTSISSGKPGRIINFILDARKLENQKKIMADLIKIGRSDLSFRFQYAKDLIERNSDEAPDTLLNILSTWLGYFRTVFLAKITGGAYSKQLSPFEQYPTQKLARIISFIQSTNFLISTTNINPKLALELLLMEL